MLLSIEEMIEEFSKALSKGKGAYFLGSGISMESGLMNWSEMLKSYSPSLYTLLEGCSLPIIAQYMVNESMGNFYPLREHAIQCVSPKKISENRLLNEISKSKVTKIWTTNYDTLIEDAFKRIDYNVKIGDITIDSIQNKDIVEIIKMHGCITSIKNIIITQDDYDFFPKNYPNTCRKLLTDLCENTFLFLGYGFNDPNIHNIIRSSQWNNETPLGRHFLITKRKSGDFEQRQQEIWAKNLVRSGIYTFYINDYPDLIPILNKISLKSRGRRVYVTGSHDEQTSEIAAAIGNEFANHDDIILLDGQSQGIGQIVLREFSSSAIKNRKDLLGRIEAFHNPYAVNPSFSDSEELIPQLKKHRTPLFRNAQFVILFDGKLGTGVEFDLAVENGCKILPVPNDYNSSVMKTIVNHPAVTSYLRKFPDYHEKIIHRIPPTNEDVLRCIKSALAEI